MKNKYFQKIIGSGIFTGYFPFASGTVASLLATVIFLIPGFEKSYIIIPMIIISFFVGIPISSNFEKLYGKDPSQCTIDEFVGTWIALLFVQKTIFNIAIAFVIWRILDITKPYPANIAENIHGGLGIMLDDVVSGIYSLILVQIILFLIN